MIRHIPFATFVAVCLMIGGWLGLMLLDNEPPYKFDAADSRIEPDPAKPESLVISDWKLAEPVQRTCPAKIQRTFRLKSAGRNIAMDTTEASRSVKIGDTRVVRSFQLPPGLSGDMGYSVQVCFECNLLQIARPLCVWTPEIGFSVSR